MALIAIGMGAVMALPYLLTGILHMVGFTSAGVAAGSLAAGLQSAIYGGATCGLFSILQSVGATACAILNPISILVGIASMAGALLFL